MSTKNILEFRVITPRLIQWILMDANSSLLNIPHRIIAGVFQSWGYDIVTDHQTHLHLTSQICITNSGRNS